MRGIGEFLGHSWENHPASHGYQRLHRKSQLGWWELRELVGRRSSEFFFAGSHDLLYMPFTQKTEPLMMNKLWCFRMSHDVRRIDFLSTHYSNPRVAQ
jgi:hypothetical protein